MGLILRRQLFLGGAALVATHRALAEPEGFDPEDDLRNLKALDFVEGGRRMVLVVPRYPSATDAPLPLAVFLHGLGETTDERAGAWAWVERYGLGSAYHRLKRAPIDRTSKRGEWTDERLTEVNRELDRSPFRGFAMACPFMPNPKGAPDLDSYARWLEESVLPRCRREANIRTDRASTFLCGVSLGGYVSLEMLTRLPRVFGVWAGLQTAIGTFAANRYAEKIAAMDRTALYILTSSLDHWKKSSEGLHAAFDAKNLAHTFRVIPGPHDQPWLREAGTTEALLWLDQQRPAPTGT